MAKILYVTATEEIRDRVSKTIQEHTSYFDNILNEKEDSRTEIIVRLNPADVDISEYDADIIVARGSTATLLKKYYPSVPIVEIPITTLDVIFSVRKMQQTENTKNEPIALIGYGDILSQASIVSDTCGVPVIPFNYYNEYSENISEDKLIMLLDDVISQGIRFVIGGIRTLNTAKKKNLLPTFIECSRESIWLAITEAQHIARIRRMERERAAHFETILNHSHEGIISTDVNNRIIHMNSSAGKILDMDTSACISHPLEKIIPDPRFMTMLRNQREYTDELFKIKKSEIVLNKVGISLGNEKIGNVVTFQDVSKVQSTEIKIRSRLYNRGLTAKYMFSDIVGESSALKDTIKKAQTFARVPSNILIIGNTGTGKELFAQSIHNYSDRKNKPFVAVNCAAIPANLMESEFFGYVGGAFTGASKDGKMGYFELAHEGTIFLDEISEIPLKLQGRLLRVIQESEVMRIGHDKIIPVNIRVICATNRDLKALVSSGKFREDLYYRLSVLQLPIPDISARGTDILLLANHFIHQYSSTFFKPDMKLSPQAENLFLAYSWNGNIRELRNVCEQLVVLNETGIISPGEVSSILPVSAGAEKMDKKEKEAVNITDDLSSKRRRFERDLIIEAMKKSNFVKTKAASLLSMNRSTLLKKLNEYDIECKVTLS